MFREGIFVLSGLRKVLLRGRLYELVAPCLNGITVDALFVSGTARNLGSACRNLLHTAITRIQESICKVREVLHRTSCRTNRRHSWSSPGKQIAPEDAVQRLENRQIHVVGLGVDVAPFLDLLESVHVRIVEEGEPDVVISDSYERDELKEINERALRSGKPWLLARPQGRQLWFGPLFEPEVSACWNCFLTRLQTNSPVNSYLRERHASAIERDRASSPATLQIAWGLIANTVASWIVREELPQLLGKMQTLDLLSWKFQSHTLVRLPFCQACGSSKQ